MSHNAYRSHTILVDEQQNKFTAMTCWGKDLVIGTEKGVLIVYEVDQRADYSQTDEGQKPFAPNIKHFVRDFSKKPITQIDVVEEEKILVSLSDGIISVHSLPGLTKIKKVEKTAAERLKGCVQYTIDRSEGVLKMVACLRRKLAVCEWRDNDFIVKKELSVPETVKTCLWCGQSLCIGFKGEYNLIDIQTGAMTQLFFTGRSLPLGTSLPGQQILLGRDNISVFIGHDGKPTRRYGLSWTETPLATEYDFPYVIALLPKSVEVQLVFGLNLHQSFPIPGAAFVAVSSDGSAYIANKTKNWIVTRLTPIDFAEQLDQLEKRKRYPEARTLCENLEKKHVIDRDERLQRLQLLNAYKNFNESHYGRAMDTFFAMKLDPLQVIALYRDLLPPKLQQKYNKFPIDIDVLQGPARQKALVSLVSYLEQKRKDLKMSETLKQKALVTSSVQGYGKIAADPEFDVGPTEQVDWENTTGLGQIIDTTLLRAYVQTDASFIGPLLALPNYCHVQTCVTVLTEAEKYTELISLYNGRGYHREALQLLQTLGQRPGNPLSTTKASIDYMRRLGKDELDLIFEFSKWVLKATPNEGLKIFLEIRKPAKQLPPTKVLAYLEGLATNNPDLNVFVVKYLEFVVTDLRDETPEIHNKLAFAYFSIVLSLKRESDANTSKVVAGMEKGKLGQMRTKLLDFLEDSKFYQPAEMLSRYNFVEEGLHEERAILLSRIGQHYEALQEYVHKLRDFSVAEEYCASHYDKDHEEARDVYLSLLKVYMSPPSNEGVKKEDLKQALELLNKHYKEIDTAKALEVLPEHLPLSVLDSYLEKVIREINQDKRNQQIISNLQICETMKVKSELLNLRSRVIKITDDTVCPCCNRRLGDAAFAYYPNGTVIHWLCYKKAEDKNVCPVTHERFDDDTKSHVM